MTTRPAPELTAALERIFQAVEIRAPGSFSFAGRPAPETPAPAPGQPPVANQPVAQLQDLLYQHCYCRRFDGTPAPEPQPAAPDEGFARRLSEANASRQRWDVGWQIARVEPSGQVTAHKHGRTRAFWPGEFVSTDGSGMRPAPGAVINVAAQRESLTTQPGFYFVFGERLGDQEEDFMPLRLYWNVGAEGAPELVRLLSGSLNRFQVPFRFKCLVLPSQYDRLDVAVLFVSRRYFRLVAELVADAWPELGRLLGPETPLFTKSLAPGLGLAEDPGSGESFGQHRCRIVSEAVWGAAEKGQWTVAARLAELGERFERYGLSLARPYLNPRSSDVYEVSLGDS